MAQQKEYSWDKYVKEAEGEPFTLRIDDKKKLVFDMPTGTGLMRIDQGMRTGDVELILRAIAGDQWPELEKLFGKAGHKAFVNIAEDMLDHFDLYEEVTLIGPGGGRVKRKRPREIRAMMEQGYRPAGEGQAS